MASFEVVLPTLEPLAGGRLVDEGDYDAVELRGLDLSGQSATNARFLECGLYECRLDQADLRRARIADCLLVDLQAVSLDVAESSWRDSILRGCRFGALVAHGATLTRVRVVDGKLDYVNLRGATLTDVRFEGCQISELDLGGAELHQVSLAGCRVERIDFSEARLHEVDLSGAQLHELTGVADMAGAVISEVQLADLAVTFATHLGIRVRG